MSPDELDALLAPEAPPWRPSLMFLADLADRFDAVDAELEAERDRIPTDHARNESSVLFDLEAFATPPPLPDPAAANEPSGLIRLEPPPIPAPLDSGTLAVADGPRRRRPRAATWGAAGLLAATLALVAGPGAEPTGDAHGPPPGAAVPAAASPAAAAAADRVTAAAVDDPAPTAPRADAPAEPLFALRACFGPGGVPAGASVKVAQGVRGGVSVELTPAHVGGAPLHACLARAAARLARSPRGAGLRELTLDGPALGVTPR